MAKSLSLVISILLPLFLSLSSSHALLQPAIVPNAACGSLNIIPGLTSPAVPVWSPYQEIMRPYYPVSSLASPSCSNLAAISPYSAYAYSNVAAISPALSSYNAANLAVAASPAVNALALNQLQANQYLMNQMQANQLLNQQQSNQLLSQQQANQLLNQVQANQALNQLQANQLLLSAVQTNPLVNPAAAFYASPAANSIVV